MNKKQILMAAAVGTLTIGAPFAGAQEEESGPVVRPVEIFTCNYNEDKGPEDLDATIKKWNKWADKQDVSNYFAMTMTPYYYGDDTFQVGWLGASESGTELGALQDAYSGQTDLQQAFGEVVSCNNHANFATIELKEPKSRDGSTALVMSFSDCSVGDGKTMSDAFGAIQAWADYQTEAGYQNGSWVMFPAYGVTDPGYDFKIVESNHSHAQMGGDYDLYGNGGGYQKAREILGDTVICTGTRVYNGTVRREFEEE